VIESLIATAGQVITLFLLMAVGYTLKKLKKIDRGAISQLTFFLLYVVIPCLIVRSIEGAETTDYKLFVYSGMGCAAYFAIGIVLGLMFYKKQPPDTRRVLRFGSVYPNNGFMGFPLVTGIFGDEAAICAAAFLIGNTVIQWTHGVSLQGGREYISIKKALINPGTLAFMAGAALFVSGVGLPAPLGNAVGFLADTNTPIAMVIIGAQMADADIAALLRMPEMYINALLKLLVFPALTAVALYPLRMPPLAFCVTIVLAATPTGGMTSMFAERYGRDTATAAQAVSFTTLLSVATLPVFAAVVRRVTGL
jgi:predicted permease